MFVGYVGGNIDLFCFVFLLLFDGDELIINRYCFVFFIVSFLLFIFEFFILFIFNFFIGFSDILDMSIFLRDVFCMNILR